MSAISTFQFMPPYLIRAEFNVHQEKNDETTNQVDINISKKEQVSSDNNSAILEVTVQLNRKDQLIRKNTLFDAAVTMVTQFRWEEAIPKDKIENLLRYNGVAVLLSYIRPILSTLSSASPYATYHLPYINLDEMYKSMEKDKSV